MPGILGTKIGMTRIFREDGTAVPVTVIKTEKNEIVQIKTQEKDGYSALVLGFTALKKPKKTRKYKHLKEMLLKNGGEYQKGDFVGINIFEEGEMVSLTGVSKGKGFAGGMKRWNFSGGPGGHGSHFHRRPGSIGCRAKPGRVEKGKKMAGRMGGDNVCISKCQIVLLDPEKSLLAVKGAVPGAKNSLLIIKKK